MPLVGACVPACGGARPGSGPGDEIVSALRQRITFRLAVRNETGMLGRVTTCVDDHGAGVYSIVRTGDQRHVSFRDISVDVRDEAHSDEIAIALSELPGVELLAISDHVLDSHERGKIRIA